MSEEEQMGLEEKELNGGGAMDTSNGGGGAGGLNTSSCTEMEDGSKNEDDRKLFVGGLPQDAKESDIREHFSTFGEIESINLKTDPHTGRSRGFAFVVFKSVDGLEGAVKVGGEGHVVKSKKVAVKKAQAKPGKIYVGKLKGEVSDEDIKSHFSQFGTILTIEQPFDKTKNERKNFCFITFEKEEPAKKLLKEGTVTLKGLELEIKKVTPKADPRGMGGPMGGGYGGGRGGGRGGANAGSGPWGGYGGQWAGYGDYYGGWGGGYGADPYYGGWGSYGGGWGGSYNGGGGQAAGGGFAGGKTPRGGPRGGGQARGGSGRGGGGGARGAQRQKPY